MIYIWCLSMYIYAIYVHIWQTYIYLYVLQSTCKLPRVQRFSAKIRERAHHSVVHTCVCVRTCMRVWCVFVYVTARTYTYICICMLLKVLQLSRSPSLLPSLYLYIDSTSMKSGMCMRVWERETKREKVRVCVASARAPSLSITLSPLPSLSPSHASSLLSANTLRLARQDTLKRPVKPAVFRMSQT